MSKLKIQRPTLNADGTTTYKEIANIAKYDGGVRVFKLMESDYIQPKFSLHDSITLKTGDMIDDADLGVFRFRSDHYKPTYNKDKGGFDYNPQIDAWYYLWSNRILKYRPTLPASETSFSLTGTLKMHIELLFANIKAWGETFRGEEVTFIIDAENVKNEAVFMSYENISWIDALNTLCDSDHFDCEWWFVDNILYLGKCEQEDSTYVEFTNGKNVNDMKPSDNQSGYATRLYAFGGTTNITSRYRKSLIYEVTDVNTYQYSQLLIKDATRALKSSYFKSKQKSLPASYSINNVQIVPATSKAHLVSYVSLPVTYGDAITVDLSKVETSCDLLNKNGLRVDPSETEYSLSVIAKYSITKSGTTSEVALATSASTNIGATLPNLNFSISEDKKTTAINWLRVYFVMDITIHNSNTAYVMAGYNGTFTPSNEYPSIITTLCFDGNNYTVTVNPDKSTDVDMEILLPAGLKMKAGDHYTLPDIISGTVPTGQFTDPQSDKVTYQGVVSDRLMLPSGTPYIDIKDITGVSVPTESIIEKVLVYDDIYPRITGHALTNVTSEVVEETDESTGAVTDKYVQYTVEDSTLTFDEDCIIPGYTVQMIFQIGDLAGQTLDVNYVNGKFIIVKDKDLDLPNTTLCPKVGDEYILTNIDTAYFTSEGSDTLVAAAEKELKTQVIEDGKKLMIDSANYECEMAAHYMYNKGDIRKFNLGQHVTLINPAYFGAENRKSRIIGYSFPLDYSYNKPTYIIGESVTYSKLGSMSKQIKSIQYNGNNYVVSGTTGGQSTGTVYTIVRYDDVKELTDSNVLSSKRAIKEIANRSLSRLHDDSVHGLITHFKKDKFLKGAQFGPVYREGVEGEGGSIDGQGNAEFGTVTARGSFTASEFSFNRISIIEGQEQMSPAIGTILSVYKNENGAKVIRMKLEGDDYGSFKVGDMVRGMYNTCGLPGTQYVPIDKDGNKGSEITDASVDINGFPMRKGFYTSYFQVTSILTDNVYDAVNNCRVFEFTYQNMDGWVDANGVEIEPCALMKIASYANPNDETRQGFHFRNSIGKRYYVIYTHCTTWQLHSWNVLKAFGEIKGMQFLVGGSTTDTTTLDNDGTYEAGSFYINGELKNINPTTYDDITKKLKSYNVVASKRSDTINVDSVGNVIGGYWSVVTGADGNTYKAFKLNTAVAVFKADGTPLLLNGTQGDETDLVTEGQYAVYATGSDCTPMVKDGVVYIIAINNIHDGDATSHDSIDYDTMRAMKECVVTITVDCEGLGVRTIDYRVVINHKDTAYISAHLDNEVASISYNTKSSSYLGLPVSTKAHMYHNNDELTLTGMTCSTSVNGLSISVNPSTGLLTISQATASVNDVIDNNVIIPIDVTTMYSGASYEQTLYFKLAKSADNNTYELKPSTSAINAVKTSDNTYVYSDGGKVSCGVKCTSTDDGIYELTSSVLSARGFKMQYSFNEDNNGDSIDDRTYSDYTLGDTLDVTSHNEVSFRMVRISDSLVIDKQTIPVVRGGLNGIDGLDFEYVFCRQTSKPAAPDYTGANKITDSYTDDKGVVWYDHPQGIDDLHPQEWMAFRTSVNAADGSKTFKGQSFEHVQSWESDGDGLEYIYAINNSATTPPTLSQPSNYNTDATCQGDDYIPSGWADDSLVANISEQNPYCWRAMRKKSSGGLWGWFSTPKIAAYMGTDGVAFNCSPSAFIIETYNNGVPKAAGSQNFTFTATKKSTDLTPGSVTATESESTDTSWDTGTAGILKLSWDNSNALVSHVITASVTFKDSDNNSYSHNFIIPITLAKQGDAGAPSVSYELQTNVNAFTFSLGDNAINWGNSVTDNPTITPSNVVSSESSITCVAKKRIGQQAAVDFTSGALYFVTSANTAKDAETLYSSINSGAGLINLNTNYYQCSFIEFRLYDSTSKTTLLTSKAVNINYDTTAYFAKLKEAIVGSIADGKGGIASFFNMTKDGLHFGANTIVNTAITSIFSMMESAIADKALELIAKNTSYNVIDDKVDMSDWTNTGATISSSNGYNGYGAYIPTNSSTTYKDYLVKNLYLKADSLYIFEFYAKGTDVNSQLDSYIYPNVNARIVSVNVDAVNYVQDGSDTYCRWSLTTDWKKYVVVFKTMATMTETEQKSILFRLLAGKTACYVSNVKLSLSSYLVGALSGTTEISGGLILSNLMGVRDATGKVQAYMNGLLSKAYAMALGITNFGTENEDSMTHFAFDGSAKIGNLQVKSDGTTYLIDKNKIQRVLLSPDELDSLANLTANVGQTSNYSAAANAITASAYGGYTNSVNLCSAFTVQYSGSIINYSSFTLYASITKGFNLTVVVELTNGSYTTQIASLRLDAIDNKTLSVVGGTIYGIPAGSYYFRLRAEMYTGNNIEFYVSSSAFRGVVSKTNNDQIQGIFARDGFASVYGPKQYTYVKQGLLYAGGWPQISGILLSGTITRYGGKSSAYNFYGPLTNYTTTSISMITSSDPHRYRVTFGTALKSNDYNIIATTVYDSTTDGRSAVVYSRHSTYFEVYINDGGDGNATDTGFSFILVGDLMTLTKE